MPRGMIPAVDARLQKAVLIGDVSQVIQALDAGARVDATDGTGSTALHWAAYKGHDGVARVLVARGASTTARNNVSAPVRLGAMLAAGGSR